MIDSMVYDHALHNGAAADIPDARYITLFPGSHGVAANNIWTGTGLITGITVSAHQEIPAVLPGAEPGPILVYVYDAIVEANQLIVRGGAGANAGRIDAGTAYNATRSTNMDIVVSSNSGTALPPAQSLGWRQLFQGNTTENGHVLTDVAAAPPQPVNYQVTNLSTRFDVAIPCHHGMQVLIANQSGRDLLHIGLGQPALSVTVEYIPWVRGAERARRSTLPSPAAAV